MPPHGVIVSRGRILQLLVFSACLLGSSYPASADAVDDHVATLANDLTGPNPTQACKDLDSIRAIYGPDKIRPALTNMFTGRCSDQLIRSIPLDSDSLRSYMVAVWNGNVGSRRAYNTIPKSPVSSQVATDFLKANANCPSAYLVRFIATPATPDGLAAAWAVLNMPPCPPGIMPGSGTWGVYDDYEAGRGSAANLLKDQLKDLQTALALTPSLSNTVRFNIANAASITLTCDHAQFLSNQPTLDQLAAGVINVTELMRDVPAMDARHAAPVTSYVRMLEAIRSCNGTVTSLTPEIQSFLGHPDPTVRQVAGYPPFTSCMCQNW